MRVYASVGRQLWFSPALAVLRLGREGNYLCLIGVTTVSRSRLRRQAAAGKRKTEIPLLSGEVLNLSNCSLSPI